MEDLPLGRIVALVPEFAVEDVPLGRKLMMMILRYMPWKLESDAYELEDYNHFQPTCWLNITRDYVL